MAKKKSKEEMDLDEFDNQDMDDNGEERKGSKITGFIVAILIIAIWLGIFALLIKMDVGGFGSTVLRPLLKDVPVISSILPDATDSEIAAETGYKYKNLAAAVERIKQLEKDLATYQTSSENSAEQIRDLTAEVARLKAYEANQTYFEELKKKFDQEVVFTANAPDIETYKSWYEMLDAENAAQIYQQVIEKLSYSSQVKDWAETYSKMDAAAAAKILQEMTGDMDLVSKILLNMTSTKRGAVLAQMDSVFAAKITKIMYPE